MCILYRLSFVFSVFRANIYEFLQVIIKSWTLQELIFIYLFVLNTVCHRSRKQDNRNPNRRPVHVLEKETVYEK